MSKGKMDFEKKLKKLLKDSRTPKSHIAAVLGMSTNLFRYYLDTGITVDQAQKLRSWAAEQSKRFEEFVK